MRIEVERFDSAGAARAAVADESVDAAVAGGWLITPNSDPPPEPRGVCWP